MLHISSGRNNFGVVKADNINNPTSSPPQQISAEQAQLIQQQTQAAIQTASEANQANRVIIIQNLNSVNKKDRKKKRRKRIRGNYQDRNSRL
jgi:hypothetical protein